MLFIPLVIVALLSSALAEDQRYADLDVESGYWIKAIFDEECQTCSTPSEIEIVEEPQHEIPVEPQSEIKDSTDEKMPPQTTIHICEHLVESLKDLESSHPQVKVLKKELKRKLKKSLPQFLEDLKHQRGDWRAVVISLLDYIIYLAEDLKSECHVETEVTHKPVLEPEYPLPEPEYEPQQPEYEPQQPEYEPQQPEYEPQQPEYEPQQPDYQTEPEYVPEQVQEVYEEVELGSSIYPGFVGSLRGIPGEHYPNYTEVPITSFSCADKKYIPGFYADLETGCQVFHVCYEHRRESFLCPVGTIFNQPILACDYWYSSNCSQAPLYYDVNAHQEPHEAPKEEVVSTIGALITTVIEGEAPQLPPVQPEEVDLARIVKFLPVKAKVTVFKKPVIKTVVASKVTNKIVPVAPSFSVVKPVVHPVLKPLPLAKAAVVKAKFAAAIPAAKVASKVVAGVSVLKTTGFAKAAAIPVKAKFITKAAAVPVVAKAKVAAKIAPIVTSKVIAAKAVPVVKAKFVAKAAVPVKVAAAGAFTAAKAVPVVKVVAAGALTAAKAVPAAKFATVKAINIGKFAATAAIAKPKIVAASVAGGIPLVKAKLATAAISPLTKKALALGYMKLLKAKKVAVVG